MSILPFMCLTFLCKNILVQISDLYLHFVSVSVVVAITLGMVEKRKKKGS
jgi:hypothetical protein